MTRRPPDIPLCGLSFNGDWTPRNRIFFSQCIQESDEEECFYSQKKKWKGKLHSYGYGEAKRKYMVYKYVSSESDESSSSHRYEERVKKDEYESHSDPEKNQLSDELNSEDKQEERVKIDEYKSHSTPEENHICNEINSENEKENNVHHKQSTVKKKNCKSDSFDEWQMNDSDKSSSNDASDSEYSPDDDKINISISSVSCDSKDSSDDDHEVATKKKEYQKSKKRSKKNVKNKKLQSPPRSEYEKRIQKTRDENIALLKSLKVLEAKENFTDAVKTLKPQRLKEKNKRSFTKDSDGLVVCRQSLRRKILRKEETFACTQTAKLHNELSFEKALRKGYVYHDFISEVNETKHKIPPLLDNDYVSHFEKMTHYESAKVSQSCIHSMAVHGSQENIIICAGNANGEIILWHMNSDYDFCSFQPHLRKVSCLKFNPYSPNILISSSDDGTVYCGDFEKKIFHQIFKAERCNHFDLLSPTSYLIAHGIGYVSILDVRTYRRAFEKRHLCHENIVKTVNLHPLMKNYFISAHQNGAVRLWDLRKLQNNPVIETYCTGGKLESSFFSPVPGNSVLVTMSNAICLLDSSSLYHEFKLKKSIEFENRHYQATWLPNSEDTFVVGSGNSRIQIFDDKLCNFFSFTNDFLNQITQINMFHPSLPLLVGASTRNIHTFSESE